VVNFAGQSRSTRFMAIRRQMAVRSLAQQAFALRGRFPEVTADLTPTRLIWKGKLQPTALSRSYTVEITYRLQRVPVVKVLSPPLESRPSEPLPHVYSDGTLCLNQSDEWTPDMFIVDSTLPWTAEWLINYEIWKATGEWHGGGQWPTPITQGAGLATLTRAPSSTPRDSEPSQGTRS